MNEHMPQISVIMPTYNTPVPILAAAVDSILAQSFQDFEFIILDDCSTDDSVEYLASLNDARIRVIRNQENLGITKTLNVGLSHARGQFIARMDSDDISLPQRFEKQLAFMQAHPDVIVCGTWIEAFGDASYVTKRMLPEREYLRCSFIYGNVYGLSHPTAFFRTEALRAYGIRYDEQLPTAQDYSMWTLCAEYGQLANVEEVLLRYRVHNGQISVAKRTLQQQCALHVQTALLQRIVPGLTPAQAQAHEQMCRARVPSDELVAWAKKLKQENKKTAAYPTEVFDRCADDFVTQKFTDYARVVRNAKELLWLLLHCPSFAYTQMLKSLFGRLK